MDRLPALVESDRLLLRQWVRDDAVPLWQAIAASLDHLRPWMAWAAERSPIEELVAFIDEWRDAWAGGEDSMFGIFRDGEVVGGAGLHRRVGPGALEVGYWVHVERLRRGYATEAAEALTGAAFAVNGIERVEIHHDKANVASGGIPRRLGFEPAGESPREVTAPAEAGIECRWVMTREMWTQR